MIEKNAKSTASTTSRAPVSGMDSPRPRVAGAAWTTSPVPDEAAAGVGAAPGSWDVTRSPS